MFLCSICFMLGHAFFMRFSTGVSSTTWFFKKHFSVFSCHNCFYHIFFPLHYRPVPGVNVAASGGGPDPFSFCVCRSVSLCSRSQNCDFEFLYVPLPDCWPWERPVLTTLNWDLYHFSITCCAFYRPCVTFLTVDTPSIALSSASDSS